MNASFPFLSASIWLPIVAGLVLLAIGNDRNARLVRWLALAAALAGFLVTVPLYTEFNSHSAALQFQELTPWVERFSINYHLGVDGISVWFVLLTAFITVVVVVAGWEVIEERVAGYMASFLILSGLMIGVFSAVDGLLFYVFLQGTLISLSANHVMLSGAYPSYHPFPLFLITPTSSSGLP